MMTHENLLDGLRNGWARRDLCGHCRSGGAELWAVSAQAKTVALFRSVGCVVWVLSDRRRARVNGFPDLIVVHHRFKSPLAWEHKQKGEKVSAAQWGFRDDWLWGNGMYGRGDYNDARVWLEHLGLIAKVA